MKYFKILKKLTAVSLAAALLLEVPGVRAYAALGEIANPGGDFSIGKAAAVPSFSSPLDISGGVNLDDSGLNQSGLDLKLPVANSEAGQTAELQAAPIQFAKTLPAAAGSKNTQTPESNLGFAPKIILAGSTPSASSVSKIAKISSSLMGRVGLNIQTTRAAWSRIFDGSSQKAALSVKEINPIVNSGFSGNVSQNGLTAGLSHFSPQIALDPVLSVSSSNKPQPPSGPRGSKIFGAAASFSRVAMAGAAVVFLQGAAVHLLPAVFGFIPVAGVWAVMSGALALPAAVYTRYRLSRHDSSRLNKVKWLLDASIGALLGASVVAFPWISVAIAAPVLPHLLTVASLSVLGSVMAISGGGAGLNSLFGAASLVGIKHWIGVASTGAIGLAPLFGMIAIPAIATISFFLRFIINAAENGQAFSIPGALMGIKMRFPTFQWVMTGVVFALLSGFSPWHANLAFWAWQFLADPKIHWDKTKSLVRNIPAILFNFNVLYGAVFLAAAVTGFSSPATFLVLAFLPERAAHWTEALLRKFLPASAPNPSTQGKSLSAPQTLIDKITSKLPGVNRWLRTVAFLSTMLGSAALMGFGVFGFHSLLKVSISAIVMAGLPFIFSAPIIKKLQKAKDTDRTRDPAIFRVVDDLRSLENANRPGRKPIPVPEVVILPTPLPNAFATGPSPFHAMVGVTEGTKEMLLTPENLRQNLLDAIASVKPESDEYKVLRRTIVETLGGASETDAPAALSQAVKAATPADIERLGERYLRGVLAHEFTHVMDRHMLSNFIMGSILNAINFAAYALIWSVVVGRKIIHSARQVLTKNFLQEASHQNAPSNGNFRSDNKENFVPLAIPAAAALPALIRVFLALWAPIFLQIVQIAASRNDEAQADEGGARLVRDPQALAAALVLLTNWKPAQGFKITELESARLALSSRLFTVSPIEQLTRVGLLAGVKSQGNPTVSRGDDWLFYLMIMNHPETPSRIKELWQMSENFKKQNMPPAPFAAR